MSIIKTVLIKITFLCVTFSGPIVTSQRLHTMKLLRPLHIFTADEIRQQVDRVKKGSAEFLPSIYEPLMVMLDDLIGQFPSVVFRVDANAKTTQRTQKVTVLACLTELYPSLENNIIVYWNRHQADLEAKMITREDYLWCMKRTLQEIYITKSFANKIIYLESLNASKLIQNFTTFDLQKHIEEEFQKYLSICMAGKILNGHVRMLATGTKLKEVIDGEQSEREQLERQALNSPAILADIKERINKQDRKALATALVKQHGQLQNLENPERLKIAAEFVQGAQMIARPVLQKEEQEMRAIFFKRFCNRIAPVLFSIAYQKNQNHAKLIEEKRFNRVVQENSRYASLRKIAEINRDIRQMHNQEVQARFDCEGQEEYGERKSLQQRRIDCCLQTKKKEAAMHNNFANQYDILEQQIGFQVAKWMKAQFQEYAESCSSMMLQAAKRTPAMCHNPYAVKLLPENFEE
jgi:hypothetical protein